MFHTCISDKGNSEGSLEVTRNTPETETKITAGRAKAARLTSITTAELFGGARELIILHADVPYRLRITSNGKLILTK